MKKVIAMAAMLALMLVAGAGYAFASANPDNNGNATDPPGQSGAAENCDEVVDKQNEKGVSAGGGPKQGFPAPTNCDHYYQP